MNDPKARGCYRPPSIRAETEVLEPHRLSTGLLLLRRTSDRDRNPVPDLRRAPCRERGHNNHEHGQLGGGGDTFDVSHEVGHILGRALHEYFTVNGVDWGVGRKPTGAIMNNPANPPVARHYSTVRQGALERGCAKVARVSRVEALATVTPR